MFFRLMINKIKTLFQGPSRRKDRQVHRNRPRLQDGLEGRVTPAISATLSGGAVVFVSSGAADSITITANGGSNLRHNVSGGGFADNDDLNSAVSGTQSLSLGSVTSLSYVDQDSTKNDTVILNSNNDTFSNVSVTAATTTLTRSTLILSSGSPTQTNFNVGDSSGGQSAILAGSGTILGNVAVRSDGTMSPGGTGVGLINTNNLSFASGSKFNVNVNGSVAGTSYDQVNVTGSVNLGSATFTATGTTSYTGNVTIINNDGSDAVTGTFTGRAEGSTLTINGMTFTLTYVGGDGNDVVLKGPNQAPVVASTNATVTVNEGSTATNTGTFSDANGNATVTITANVGSVTQNNTAGTWSWSYNSNDGPDQSQTVTITATDSVGAVATTTFALTVNNVAPTVAATSATVTVNEGATASNTGTYGDVGQDTVTLTASAGTIIDNNNGTWSWSFHSVDGPSDSQTVTITATDSDSAVRTTTFALTVNNVAPTLVIDIPVVTVNESVRATNIGGYSDPGLNPGEVTFTASIGSVTVLDGATWVWSAPTTDGPDGSQTVTITAMDASGASDSETFTLVVRNIAPSLTIQTSSLVLSEGQTFTNQGTFADLGLDTVSVSASVGALVQNVDGTWTWSYAPTDGIGAVQTVSITATDSDGASTVKTFTIRANNVVPTAAITGATVGVPTQSLSYNLTATDISTVDQAAGFRFDVKWGDGTANSYLSVPSAIANHAYKTAGNYTIEVKATDKDRGISAVQTFSVTVSNGLIGVDPADSSKTALFIGGSALADTIVISEGATDGTIDYTIAGLTTTASKPTGRVFVYGGDGNDVISTGSDATFPVVFVGGLGSDRLIGGVDNDELDGGDGNDTLVGGDGDDTISGGVGADSITGGAGSDRLIGGVSNDRYVFQNATTSETDVIVELLNGGVDTLDFATVTSAIAIDLSGTGLTLGSGVNRTVQVGEIGQVANVEGVIGGSGNDVLTGNHLANSLSGGAGNDSITGGLGNDTLSGGVGTDVLTESGDVNFTLTNSALIGLGTDVVNTFEQVHLTGGTSNNTINASAFTAGVVVVDGGAGNDTIRGGTKNDSLVGGEGDDLILGHAGNDSIQGGAGRDIAVGGLGTDTIDGGSGDDLLIGGSAYENDMVAWSAIMSEWNSLMNDLTTRRSNIMNGSIAGGYRLDSTTITNDNSVDNVTGGADCDWFLAHSNDVTTDVDPTMETRDVVAA